MLMAGSGISTTGISSTTVKQTSIWKPNLSGLYLFIWKAPPTHHHHHHNLSRDRHRAGELVTQQKCQWFFNLMRGDLSGIDIFSRKTSRVCVRIIWLGPSVCHEYFGGHEIASQLALPTLLFLVPTCIFFKHLIQPINPRIR